MIFQTQKQVMEMEKSHSMVNDKSVFLRILGEAMRIPSTDTNFIIFTFLASLPLVCLMVPFEIFLQPTLNLSVRTLTQIAFHSFHYHDSPDPIRWIQQLSHGFFQVGIFYIVPLHLLDLLNISVIVNLASSIYAGEKVSFKEIIHGPRRIKEPLITSIYVLLMSFLVLIGFIWLVTNYIFVGVNIFSMVLFGVGFLALMVKWMDWSSVWSMGIVVSILEGREGVEAFGISAYFGKGRRGIGLFLMLIFFIWKYSLRLSCLYLGWKENGSGVVVILAHVVLICMGNVMKWAVCLVYFYHCKKRVLEKKVDVEDGEKLDVVNAPLT